MKTLFNLSLILIAISLISVFTSCNFSMGTKKDLVTGLAYSYSGFRVKDVSLYDTYKQGIRSKKVSEGTMIYIRITGVEGFAADANGFATPTCHLTVTDSKGSVVLDNENLYKDIQNTKPESLKALELSVRLLDPIVAGDTYTIKAHLSDAINTENTLDIEYVVSVTPSENKIEYTTTGLDVDKIYLIDQNGILPQDKAYMNSQISVLLSGVKNFTTSKGKVFLGCELTITDKDGSKMLYSPDLFAQYTDGVDEAASSTIKATATLGSPMAARETYKIWVRVFDKKNSNNVIKVNSQIEIIE